MIQRCYNAKTEFYSRYGGRGITVCERWHKFENFSADMGNRPPKMSIDRINNDGNYSCGKCAECIERGWKANCEWRTSKEQRINRQDVVLVTYNGKTQTVMQWAQERRIKAATLYWRVRRGWPTEKALELE